MLWFGVYNVALNAGERRVDAGTAAMLIQVSPVLVAVLAAIFLNERFTVYIGLGLALAFSGVGLISMSSSESSDHDVLGVLLCLVSAVVYSISLILQKPLVAKLPAIHVTWLACTIGAIACLPFVGQLVDQTRDAPTSSVLWVVYLGVFPTAIAFTTYAYALQHMSASSLGDHDLPRPADHDRDGRGLPRRGAARDGVRRRRARPGRRGRRAAQADADASREEVSPPA